MISSQQTPVDSGETHIVKEIIQPTIKPPHSDVVPAVVIPNGSAKAGTSELKCLPPSYYANFLSNLAKERKPSPIRSLFPLEKTPGLISLLAGKPNPTTFPFTSLSFTSRSPTNPDQETTLTVDGEALAQGLQYGDTAGLKGLRDWIYSLQEREHGRKQGEGWCVSVGAGSQDLIYKAVQAMVNEGDSVLVESPVYAGVIPMFESLHCEQIEVQTDSQGIMSNSLRSTLENWPVGKSKPKVLYTVPYGCNPTGMTATLERRKEVLQLAREHHFIILEDDPYYYLYYGNAPRYPSYFTLELEETEVGRVLRFDSLSKILSAGIRIGFASGPEALLQAIDRHTATSNLQTSSLTQAITFALLDSWGYEGFKTHTARVSAFYREKRDVFEAAMKRHLTGLAEWDTPEAGMFFWFKLLLSATAAAEEDGDSEAVIQTTAFNRGVLALPGTVFLPNGRKTAYVRAAFSLTGEEDVDRAVQRLREAILDARGASAAST
ncbi:PLP-dependent transferase [Crucibulum laeve]|uniref:PLP-dependent transferase n=1 Tax=Crucibulum laeve TaxID=68775 RepID=A0A5C3LX15_9AGAR|nr:PLP-dependent transferase [Crucibulum laeve]